jgi:hypothetical protein
VTRSSKRRETAERNAKEKAKREKEQAEKRSKYLDDLVQRETATWKEIDDLIATKLPKSYDRAVALLVDLRDLAQRFGTQAAFETRVRELRERHRSKSSLQQRFA